MRRMAKNRVYYIMSFFSLHKGCYQQGITRYAARELGGRGG
jgi:hypothetical protein